MNINAVPHQTTRGQLIWGVQKKQESRNVGYLPLMTHFCCGYGLYGLYYCYWYLVLPIFDYAAFAAFAVFC